MTCYGSVVLEAGEPNVESEYAAEGTLAHTLAAHCLTNKIDAKNVLMVLAPDGKSEIISQEMAEYVQEYLDHIYEAAAGHHLMVEQRLDIEWLTGEKGAKGTADAVIASDDGDFIQVIDLKYGMGVRVAAAENPQLRIYGLAALNQFEMLGDFKKIKLSVYQPRLDHVDSEELSVKELMEWAANVKLAASEVRKAQKSNSLNGFLHPSKKACKFCKAKARCPALANIVSKETGADFDDITQTALVAPIDLSAAMDKIELIEQWCTGVRSKVESELLSGTPVKGYKLVEGKLGNRKWINEAENGLKTIGLHDEDIYETSMRTPAALEKKIKKKKPDLWNEATQYYSQKAGQPSVAPSSDPRSAYNPKHENDFEVVE